MRRPVPLLLVRHARAEDEHPLGDEARGLDRKGRRDFREHARALARRVKLRGIASSPLVRAVQTAEILGAAAGLEEIAIRGELSGGDPDAVLRLARELGDGWALVGHNPDLALAAASAVGRAEAIRLRKGAAVALVPDGERWSLAWLAAPGRPVLTSFDELD
jgi:phosphohistidine phosphatase